VRYIKSLVKRGLKGVKLVVSDAHEGLKAAIARVLRATWQRCRVHWMRNALFSNILLTDVTLFWLEGMSARCGLKATCTCSFSLLGRSSGATQSCARQRRPRQTRACC
jgi:hypothetical protein